MNCAGLLRQCLTTDAGGKHGALWRLVRLLHADLQCLGSQSGSGKEATSFKQWIATSKSISATTKTGGSSTNNNGRGDKTYSTNPVTVPSKATPQQKPSGAAAVPTSHHKTDSAGSSHRKLFRSIHVPSGMKESLDQHEIGWRRGRRRPLLIKADDWQHVCNETPVW